MAPTAAPTGFPALLHGAPYRLLFPTGALLALIGTLLWPLHVYGVLPAYPAVPHARIMIEGFLASFAFGFLGTAVPRLLGSPAFSAGEAIALAALLITAAGLHAFGLPAAGDQVFLVALVLFAGALAFRGILRQDIPPPAFLLAALGLLCGAGGTLLFIIGPIVGLPPWHDSLARLLLYQGFLLLPVLGAGAFLLPRFFALPSRQDFPESLAPPPGWLRRAGWALLCGAAIISGFFIEAAGHRAAANLLKFLAVAAFLLREIPLHRAKAPGTIAWCARAALLLLILAFPIFALIPAPAAAWAHMLFLGGFALLAFSVATRVLLGHSGASHLFNTRLPALVTLATCILIALPTRISADYLPNVRLSHLAYAALVWIAGVLVWSAAHLRRVTIPDSD